MPLLRTLGSVALVQDSPGGEQLLDVQQKRLALLVFLARAARGHFVRREVLRSLFWPDHDVPHGRGVLRQALSALRKQLGGNVLLTRGEAEVGLASEGLACDAVAFEQACRAGRHDAACALYEGHFLAGFHASGASPEFDQWVDVERDHLRRLAADASWQVALQLEAAGHLAWSVNCAWRAAELNPDDETGAAHLIAMLDRHGDRAGALRVYAALERRLAEGFSAQPAPETRALMRALRQRATPAGPSEPFVR
jgi:DNA-binding SARP family transcriptional activator